ncbi:phosphohistidine phosphatase SixA [Vibrio ostreicida]|uniref:Phosphohistidine phosphatase SixA n=1 Tax=Vibrio ostreicida TaxID=526588 RepID=A0ABT8BW52_9VIBR|nr:phosphohistidine phosphatase SixA [Vibrio ostreicida]MDN3610626.1 phosphohistidine phosphatase SixA [Vibrio ostreicida]NPD07376.1 phosphohistidine phosphatase SixA [Vibrio ostreicida]
MKIFIMRHGEAEHYAESDAQRSLTERGQKNSVQVVQECVKTGHSQFDCVLVSPYLRAQQTWQAVSHLFSAKKILTCDDITPYGESSHVANYVEAIAEVDKLTSVLLVSHLPLVGYLTAEFVPEIAPPMFTTSGIIGIEYHLDKHVGNVIFNRQSES